MRVHSWKGPDGTQHDTLVIAAEWSVTATASGTPATARRPGEPGRSHFITYVGGSYSGKVGGGEMILKDGGEVVADYFVHDQRGVSLSYPLRIKEGQDVSLTLASAGPPTRGACTLQGYTA